MSRKDYILIANALAEMIRESDKEGAKHVYRVARRLTEALAWDNPRFQTTTFLRAKGCKQRAVSDV